MSTPLLPRLFVYRLEPEWYVAESMAEAEEMFREQTGETWAEYDPDNDMEHRQLRDDEALTILCDKADRISDSGRPRRLTARLWAAREPKGLLCSEEY